MNAIYHGDCIKGLQELEDGIASAVIVDPPYGIDYQSARRSEPLQRHKKIANDKTPFVWFLPEAYRVTKDGGSLLCFCRWDTQQAFMDAMRWAGYAVRSSIVWDRQWHGMGDLRGAFAPCHDLIIFATKGAFRFPGRRPRDVISVKRLPANDLVHPNEKPIELIEQLIEQVTITDDLVIDPCAGSGATLVAAKRTRRRYIGYELDGKYVDICNARLDAT